MSQDNELLFEVTGHIAVITLNRPQKLNAVTPAMAKAVEAAIAEVDASDAIRCVVITGAGEKAFCAGSDISTLDQYQTAWDFRNRRDYCDALRAVPQADDRGGQRLCPGRRAGNGDELRHPHRLDQRPFAAPEIKLGWIGGGGMAAGLVHSVGASNAAMMILTGDMIDADRRWPGGWSARSSRRIASSSARIEPSPASSPRARRSPRRPPS
jgi:enoyl-CoA hydratase/carnithine racemase